MANRGDINLGDEVQDTISGFKGICVAITNWLNGCQRVSIAPQAMKDGVPYDPQTFDVEQLVIVKAAARNEPLRKTGGDRPSIGRAADPR